MEPGIKHDRATIFNMELPGTEAGGLHRLLREIGGTMLRMRRSLTREQW
jgi:hypothetical protein